MSDRPDREPARDPQDLERLLNDGLHGIGQISDVIANLKNFSRLDRSNVADFDLHEGIESSIRIGYAQLQKRVLRKEFSKIPHISCSPSQINQVILNLLSNAAQATQDDSGTITVRTGMRDAAHVESLEARPDSRFRVRVTASGFDSEWSWRLEPVAGGTKVIHAATFEPFDRWTGILVRLGRASLASRVEAHLRVLKERAEAAQRASNPAT